MYGLCGLFSSRSLCSIRYYQSDSTKKLLEFLAKMPKGNSARIAEAQRQRQHISKKSEKYGPSSVYLQVLGSGARGAPNTLYLFTDQKRYLFNCGECTQRLAHEHKVKLSKLDHIFITSKTWRNIGGLPGLSLTLQDVGVPNITLHGPEGLDELYQATRRFVIMKDMNVTMAKCSPAEDFADNVMTVKYVIMGPLDNILTDKDLVPVSKRQKLDPNADKQFEEFIHDETDYYKPEIRNLESKTKNFKDNKEKVKVKPADPIKKKTEKVLHELQKKTNPSVAYICTLKKRLGTLDLAKCVERGVKPGPMLGLLKTGQDVVLPDGTLVLSKDVKTPDDPGPVFIVLDVPDISYLKESEFSAHFANQSNPPENVPTLIVHFTAPHVFHHPQYRAFIAMFGSRTQHLVLNNQNACLGSEAVHRTQHKLHLLDPDVFPLLRDVSVPAVWNAHPPVPKTNSPVRLKGLEELKNKIALAQFQNIISLEGSCKGDGLPAEEGEAAKLELVPAHTLTMFHLRPRKEVDRSAEPKLHIQEYIQETMDMDGFAASLDQFRHMVDSIRRYGKSDAQREYPKIVFLGTGSCIPSKTRNTSAIVVHIDENRSILMDCGEGTFGQLVRFYGPRKVNAFLRTLKAIYISHLHADHHIGLIGVLQARREACSESGQECSPLHLLAPGQIVTWLTLYDHQFEKIRAEFTLIPNQNLLQDATSQCDVLTPATLASIGVQQIRTCLVAHCPNAFGVALQLDAHNKITYSGDTLPCEELVKIGENSTILIHEATMEDELAEEARTKMHSTTSQAIDIGRQMNARFTVLTHFSQRYARLPRLNAHILHDNNSVGIAFDNMQITMSDLELLPHMYAPLQLMFAEHCVEMELKAAQRARTRERRSASPAAPPLPSTANICEDRKRGRSRWVSPGCRNANSAPMPQANYVESNSSRLRQELKGMTVTGIVRNPRSRSSSASSPAKSPTRSESRQRSGTATPKKRREDSPTLKPAEVFPPRGTMSETANLNRHTPDKIELIRSRMSATPSAAGIIDTQSKTINRVAPYRPPTGDEVLNVMAQNTNKLKPADYSTFNNSPCERNGYGKPLVTPLNKKLMIRKDVPSPISNNISDKTCQLGIRTRSRSRGSQKAENRESTPAAVVTPHVLTKQKILKYAKVDIGTSVLVYVIYWRLTHITASLLSLRWTYIHSIIAVGVLFWTATKTTVSGNSSRAYDLKDTHPVLKSNVKSRQARPFSATDRYPMPRSSTPTKASSRNARPTDKNSREVKPSHHEYAREMKIMNLESNCSSLSPTSKAKSSNAKKMPVAEPTRKNQTIKSIQGNMNNRSKYALTKDSPLTASKTSQEPLPTSARPSLTRMSPVTSSKQVLGKEVTMKIPFKQNSAVHSAKSFKPQLEDIKSSYLLLNSTKMAPDNDENNLQAIRAQHFNDEMRRQQLMEVKRKFQSRQFISDSRYDKIEGLNWIPWK